MQHLREYQTLYPKDRVVVKGGYAAFLQLQRCGIKEHAKDIDVIVESVDFSGTVATVTDFRVEREVRYH